jgi:2-oxoglutarate ferredoxin oxidoreductase subunit beta
MNEMTTVARTTTLKDWETDQEVRWCPGCGDYAILKAVQRTMPEIGTAPENTVFISGIGCSSRFPYYMETYGFHTIHGRAPAFATGLKLANPSLDIWIVTGDGDGLSIGGNHTMHLIRRNLDCQIMLFNNEIMALRKGNIPRPAASARRARRRPMARSTGRHSLRRSRLARARGSSRAGSTYRRNCRTY